MISGLTSVIIPTYNHASLLPDALASAVRQTDRVEVLVIDDGSTDWTEALFEGLEERHELPGRVKYHRQEHAGPSAARNRGLDLARGEFVMFLDADDVIARDKVERQRAEFSDDIGWVLCDVRIEDEARGTRLASEQYRYAHRDLGGWIRPQLAASNFIPIMAPLVRRSVLEGIRFSETLTPEDWHFWYAVAGAARVRYLPEVLATYRKRRTGRHGAGLPNLPPVPTMGPVVLNLGCGTPGAASWHPVVGAVNLDRSMGWMFEDGLPDYADASVDGITISHALMYVHEIDWPKVVAELARVLKPGGVLRITEDDTVHPDSSRRGGWKGSEPAVTMTSPAFVRRHLEAAGLRAHDVGPQSTRFDEWSLLQAQHGDPPHVFFIEGIKP